jgi:hypothetical protein
MHDRLAADPRQPDATTGGVLSVAALVVVSIIGIVIILPSAGGVSD